MKRLFRIVIPVIVILAACAPDAESYLSDFPDYADPVSVGGRLSWRFVEDPFSQYGSPLRFAEPRTQVTYPDVCAWLGAFWFAEKTADTLLQKALIEKFEPLFGEQAYLQPPADHVDNNVFGAVPLEIYSLNGDRRCLELGMMYADSQWKEGEDYSWQTRFWLDDMFMITTVQAQAFRVSGESKYIDRAAKEMVLYLDRLPRPSGLYDHGESAPFAWGRGNGWMALGMTEVLRALPEDSPFREPIMNAYLKMMSSLLDCQAESGMWLQVLDDPSMWEESSGTAMFAYSFIVGIRNGWLKDKAYSVAARRAWIALCGMITEDGLVENVCEGTKLGSDSDHYRSRRRLTGDVHGQAPVIWCAEALLKP